MKIHALVGILGYVAILKHDRQEDRIPISVPMNVT